MASEPFAAHMTVSEVTQLILYDSDRSSNDLDLDYNSGDDPQYEHPKRREKAK